MRPTATAGDLKVDRAQISIRRAALEKEFLLNASLIPQERAPSFHSLKSRVVLFRRAGSKLIMVESSPGLLLTKKYPQALPLAEFAILTETSEDITFDFNAGMTRVLLGSDWQAHEDNEGPAPNLVAKTSLAYLSRAEIVEDRILEVHQQAVAEFSARSIYVNVPIETVYYLTPYAPNPKFKPTRAPRDLDQFGFFEVQSQYNDESGEIAFASKIDIDRPVVYAISHNTPAQYRDAIRDGVLYWNKAFGREVLRVVDAVGDVSVPSPLHNVIQWVDYDSARFAYADAQMDPRTGEILHQQVYLTSGWAHLAEMRVEKYRRQGSSDLVLSRLGAVKLCNLGADESMAQEILSALRPASSDASKLDRAVGDVLRWVVAHEVGHTLGLRHNFAGTLASNYELDQRPALFAKYFEEGKVPEALVVTSSVMDYVRPIESFLLGHAIRTSKKAAEHDAKAVQKLYFGAEFKSGDVPLFCTDTQVDEYADCQPGVAGRSVVEWIKYDGRRWLSSLPHLILNGFIRTKAPEFGEQPAPVTAYRPDTKAWASYMFEPHADLSKLLRRDRRLLSVERQFPNHGAAYQPAILARTNEVLATELARQGGFEGVLLRATPKIASAVRAEVERLLTQPEILKGRSIEGKPYELTNEEVAQIKASVPLLLNDLSLEMARAELTALDGRSPTRESRQSIEDRLMALLQGPPHRFEINPVTQSYAEYLTKRAAFFLFATRGEPTQFKKQTSWASSNGAIESAQPAEELTLTLPKFAYPFELRLKTLELLRPDRGETPAWGHHERRLLGAIFAKVFSEAVPGLDPGNTDALDGYPGEVVRWVLEAREIGLALDLGGRPGPRLSAGSAGGSRGN